MQKIFRLLAIEKIIQTEDITSQQELLKSLKKEGLSCTQATLSRNLRELGILRVPDGRGGYRYSFSSSSSVKPSQDDSFSIISAIKMMIDANSMVVIKTRPGHANSVAVVIDSAERYEIAGTIAGDDTLLVIPRDNVSHAQLHSCLETILPGIHSQVRKKG